MTDTQQRELRGFGSDAAEIAALCRIVGNALADRAGASDAGVAVEGLGTLAQLLSDRIRLAADPI